MRLTPERQDLVARVIPWAEAAARRIARRCEKMAFVDLAISAALQGSVEAAGSYHLSSKVPFEVYARSRIRGAIRDALEAEEKHWPAARLGARVAAEQVTDPSDVLTDADSDTEGHVDHLVEEVLAGGLLNFAGQVGRTQGEGGLILRETYAALLSALDQAMSGLDEASRKLVDLRYWQGQSWEEVAAALGLHVEGTKSRDRRLRQQLAVALRARGVRSAS